MNARDYQRLHKLDQEIFHLQVAYQSTKEHEIREHKTTLLLSRGIKYRLDNTIKARAVLAKLMSVNPSRRATFQMELSMRKEKLDEALKELETLIVEQQQHALLVLTNNCKANADRARELAYHVGSQKRRVANYERSLTNWASKADMVPERKTRNRVPKNYDAQADVEVLLGGVDTQVDITPQPKRIEDTAFGRSEAYLDERKAISVVPDALLNAPTVTNQTEVKKTFTFNEMAAMHAGELAPRKRFTIDFDE